MSSSALQVEQAHVTEPGVAQAPDPLVDRLIYDPGTSRVGTPTSIAEYRKVGKEDGIRSATPAEILLGTLGRPFLRPRVPLRLQVEREADQIVVVHHELNLFGYGSHLTAAITDFQDSLVELYLALKDDRERLAPALLETWGRLSELVEER